MVDKSVVVDMLCLVCNDAAVAPALGTLAGELHVESVARHTVVERYDVVVEARVALLLHVHIADTGVAYVCLLHAVEVE